MNLKFYNIKFLIIKYIILFSLFLFQYSFEILKQIDSDNLFIEIYNIYKNNETIVYLKKNIIKKFNLYINKCLNKNFEYKFPLFLKPKISAIMPLYNAEKYLKYSLSSIQNQKMKEIEIILVDDCSKDSTLLKIKNYMEKDKRIRLIKNKENRKIL